jgi:exosome complex component RRP40
MPVILPGDRVDTENSKIGPGFYQSPLLEHAKPVKAGYLVSSHKGSSTLTYLDTNAKRYIPSLKDHVLGVVVGKYAEGYRVLLQDHSTSVRLDQFAFENASKKNKPNLQLGSLVYGRVSLADKDIEPEIECFDATTGKAGGFGELKGGYLIEVSLAYARFLLFEEGAELLAKIGEKVSFEVAIGVNGKVWINAEDSLVVLKISNLLRECENLNIENGLKLLGKAKLVS